MCSSDLNDVIVTMMVVDTVLFFGGFFTIMLSGRRKGGDQVETDERDKTLSLQATFGGAMMSDRKSVV